MRKLSGILAAILLAGCAGHAGVPPQSQISTGASHEHVAAASKILGGYPAPWSPDSGYKPGHVSLPIHAMKMNVAARIALLRAAYDHDRGAGRLIGAARVPMASVNCNDNCGGMTGAWINRHNDVYTGSTWVANGVYQSPVTGGSDSAPNYVNFPVGTGELYAPTTHVPAGGCIEMGTQYSAYPTDSGTKARFFFVDWCHVTNGQSTGYYMDINSNFWYYFVRTYSNGSGYPEYISEAYKDSSGNWFVYLYDNIHQQYSQALPTISSGTDTTTGASDGHGWSIFETHYQNGMQCAPVPSLSMSGLRVQAQNGSWGYADGMYTAPYALNNGQFIAPQCFQTTSAPWYTVRGNRLTSDLGWYVDTNGSSTQTYAVDAGGSGDSGPSCTADSYGYCATLVSTTHGTDYCYQDVWDARLQDYVTRRFSTPTYYDYDIFMGIGLYGIATKTVTEDSSCNVISVTWSPSEPSAAYGDPNLP